MTYYPINLNLTGRRCVVVGGGAVAGRKARTLLNCGAQVLLIAPEADAGMQSLAGGDAVEWIVEKYNARYLGGAFLVIAATDDAEVNAAVTRDAQARELLVCRVDAPDDGNFISPATVARGDLLLTVSTSGENPTLAAVLAERLQEEFGDEWAVWTKLCGALRPDLQALPSGEAGRRAAVRRILDDAQIGALVRSGNLTEAEAMARQCL